MSVKIQPEQNPLLTTLSVLKQSPRMTRLNQSADLSGAPPFRSMMSKFKSALSMKFHQSNNDKKTQLASRYKRSKNDKEDQLTAKEKALFKIVELKTT